MKRLQVLMLIVVLAWALPTLAGPPINGQPDHNSVYNYAINNVVQTGATEVTVEAQARYCSACNPNPAGNPGCTPFTHTGWCGGVVQGTYIAVRIKDAGGTILGMKKLVLQSGVNLTLNTICTWQFVFSGLSVSAGDVLTVEADTYCSWCGHWYPSPVTLTVIGSDSEVEYTGDTWALAGTPAVVCALLSDVDTGDPLVGKTVTFTLNPVSPFGTASAITDADGIACTTMLIPSGTPAGFYTMDTRFAGDASYFPCSDQDPFEVIVIIPVEIDIKPGSFPNSINPNSGGVIPVAILSTDTFDASTVDPATVTLDGIGARGKGKSGNYGSLEDVDGDGDLDLIVQIENEVSWEPDATEATIMGLTWDGIPIEGTDSVRIVPPGE